MSDKNKGVAEMLPLYNNAIHKDAGDGFLYKNEVLPNNPRIQEAIDNHKSEFPQIEFLIEDLFNSFYKYDPQINDEGNMNIKCLINYQAMKFLLDTSKYADFRNHTRLDRMTSQIATEAFIDNAIEVLKTIRKNQKENIQTACNLQILIDDSKESGEDKVDVNGSIISIEEAKRKLSEFREKIKDEFNKKNKRKLTKGIKQALVQVESVEGCISNWGLDRNDTFQRKSYRDKVKLIEKIQSSKKLKNIAKLAGKLKSVYFKQKTHKTNVAKNTVSGIKRGTDLGKALPSDLLGLVLPEREYVFYKKYAESGIRQYEYGGQTKLGKGPIVCCIDTSMSMEGTKERWSKAVALALVDVARKQNRDFKAILFDSGYSSQQLFTINLPKTSNYDASKVVDLAEYFGGGGTDFEPPLNKSRDTINNHREFSKADIIFITDGESVVSDNWLEDFNRWKKAKNIDVFSIKIGDDLFSNRQTLKLFSSEIKKIDDVKTEGEQAAVSIFDQLNY